MLYEEVPFLLREEVREPRSYFPILAAVAAGSRKFGEISSKTGFDKANLGKYLGRLQDLQIVRRDVPITERDPAKSRKGLYFIEDPFTEFWLRYVWPNLAALEFERIDELWDRHIQPDFPGYVERRCERFLGELLRRDPVREWLGFEPATIGSYWDRHVELDLVALDSDRRTAAVAEVKWSTKPVGPDVAQKLRTQAERVPGLASLARRYLLFSRSGFTDSLQAAVPDDLCLVDLRQGPAPAA